MVFCFSNTNVLRQYSFNCEETLDNVKCFSASINMTMWISPKGPCAKCLVLSLALFEVSFKKSLRGGPDGRFYLIGGKPSEETWGHQSLSLFFFTSQQWGEQSLLHITLLPECAALSQAQGNRSNWSWAETSEILSQNKFFLFISWLPQVLCYSNRNVIDTMATLLKLFYRFSTILVKNPIFFLQKLTVHAKIYSQVPGSQVAKWILKKKIKFGRVTFQFQNLLHLARQRGTGLRIGI
jgi:hypothetical protein